MQLVERVVEHRTTLVLCGDRDLDLVRLAYEIHRRALGAEAPFVVADPRRRPRNAGLASRLTVVAALEVATGGVLCVQSRRPPRDFGRAIGQLPDVGARLVVCAAAAERCDVRTRRDQETSAPRRGLGLADPEQPAAVVQIWLTAASTPE